MSAAAPPTDGGDDTQETADFLSTQFVFGIGGSRPGVGLDVLVTKVAVDFVALTSESGDAAVAAEFLAALDVFQTANIIEP